MIREDKNKTTEKVSKVELAFFRSQSMNCSDHFCPPGHRNDIKLEVYSVFPRIFRTESGGKNASAAQDCRSINMH